MKALILLAIALGPSLVASLAHGQERASKPSVCVNFSIVRDGATELGICRDGKRPAVFSRWQVVSFADRDGKPTRYVLGWK